MNYSENVIKVLAVKTYKGIGRSWISKNIKGNESSGEIVLMLNSSSKESFDITVDDFEHRKKILQNELRQVGSSMDGAIALGDENFPKHRGNVKGSEQPIVIFYRGNLDLLNKKNSNISVIGLLNPDSEIEKIEREVVSELVKSGVTIISGLALGCDTIAHQEALRLHGNTVAILPSSLDKILPATNTRLAQDIVSKNGLLITEYYNIFKSKTELTCRYQERDRLQALFCDTIILVASYAKDDRGMDSGSRLAMDYALNYSIPRAVIYSPETNANDRMYNLNRHLINTDKDVTVISKDNIRASVKKILLTRPIIKSTLQHQQSLLGYM